MTDYEKVQKSKSEPKKFSRLCTFNPLPHGVLATFSLTAGGPIGPPKKDDISREKTILMTSVRILLASAVRREGLPYTYHPPSHPALWKGHCVHFIITIWH